MALSLGQGPMSSCGLGLEPVGILVAHVQAGIPLNLLRSVPVPPSWHHPGTCPDSLKFQKDSMAAVPVSSVSPQIPSSPLATWQPIWVSPVSRQCLHPVASVIRQETEKLTPPSGGKQHTCGHQDGIPRKLEEN